MLLLLLLLRLLLLPVLPPGRVVRGWRLCGRSPLGCLGHQLKLMRARKEPVTVSAGEVSHPLHGAIVLALASQQLDAEPLAVSKRSLSPETDDALVTEFGEHVRADYEAVAIRGWSR